MRPCGLWSVWGQLALMRSAQLEQGSRWRTPLARRADERDFEVLPGAKVRTPTTLGSSSGVRSARRPPCQRRGHWAIGRRVGSPGRGATPPFLAGQGAADHRAGLLLPVVGIHAPHERGAAVVDGDEMAAAGIELCDVESEIARHAGDVVLWLR